MFAVPWALVARLEAEATGVVEVQAKLFYTRGMRSKAREEVLAIDQFGREQVVYFVCRK